MFFGPKGQKPNSIGLQEVSIRAVLVQREKAFLRAFGLLQIVLEIFDIIVNSFGANDQNPGTRKTVPCQPAFRCSLQGYGKAGTCGARFERPDRSASERRRKCVYRRLPFGGTGCMARPAKYGTITTIASNCNEK